MLTGVAGGLAERLDVDPALVRVVWAVSMPLTGFLTLLIYVVMALVVPDEPDGSSWSMPRPPATEAPAAGPASTGPGGEAAPAAGPPPAWATDPRAQRAATRAQRRAERLDAHASQGHGGGAFALGLVLIVLGGLFLLHEVFPAIDWDVAWPVAAIVLGLLLIAAEWRRR